MKIREMNAYDRGRKVRIYVSDIVRNESCDDCRPHWGYWYCVVGGEVGYFVTREPHSGCRISCAYPERYGRSKLELSERDIFNVSEPIDSKERFNELISD